MLVLLVLAGAITAYVRLRPQHSGPAQVVGQYFADLAQGDAAGAMALVANADNYQSTAYPLLSPTALARTSARPSHIRVGHATSTSAAGRTATDVSVSYAVGAAIVHQTITVTSAASGPADGALVLDAPFVTLAVGPTSGRAVTVNGLPYPTGSAPALAFPGAYLANIAGTKLVAPATASAAYDDSLPSAVTAKITPPAPKLAAGATAAIQTAVNHALDVCAGSTSPAPADCPFSYDNSGATMKWTVVTYPSVRPTISGSGAVTFSDGSAPGSMGYSATTFDWLGFSHNSSGNATVNVAGTASVGTGGVTVTFTH